MVPGRSTSVKEHQLQGVCSRNPPIPRCSSVPFQLASEPPHFLAAGGLNVVTVQRGLEGAVVPSKLYGILAAGRPVLVVAPEESDAARIVRRYGCGVVADPDEPEAVAAAVCEVMVSPGKLAEMAARALAAEREFDQATQLRRLSRL